MQNATRWLVALAACCGMQTALADSSGLQGTSLGDYLKSLASAGLPIIYSSDLVSADQVLLQEPDPADPRVTLPALLQPYGLTLVDGPAGSLLVVREKSPAKVPATQAQKGTTPLPEIIVTSSLRRLQYVEPSTPAHFERELSARVPGAAEEAVRLINRLPGTASAGISSRSHIRGGEANEVLFLFDGLRLYEPYHLKDFQSVASVINPGAVAGIDFYTGGYPARYGDRMSGVMNIQLREPVKRMETELALSFFNASALSLGRLGAADQGDWLLAARRGNLDLIADVVNPEFGSPDYNDLLLHVGWDFGPRARLSASILKSHDKIRLNDTGVGETARANYENFVFWMKWSARWSDVLQSDTLLSLSEIKDDREGSIDNPGIVSGALTESRDFKAHELKQDWTYTPSDRWMLSLGFRAMDQDAAYRHSSVKTVLAPFDQILDNVALVTRDIDLAPDGAQYAAYTELRWQPLDQLVVDIGFRWDQQTYTTAADDRQYSPRASVLFRSSDRTEIRIGFGQFYQAQEINELQVSDGIDTFFPAQRAEHVVANLKHAFSSGIDLDVSLYRKEFRTLRPRFQNVFNSLTLLPELQFDRVMIDATRSESRGIELTASYGGGDDDLFWWLGYAWSEVEDTTASGKIKRGWDQTHTGKLGVGWRWGVWNMSAAGEVHTGWPRTLITTRINSSRYATFHALDARVSRDFDLKRGSLTAFLEVTNLYNRKNPCCMEYSITDGPGGADQLVGTQKYWLPAVPSLGVVWRF